MTDEERKQFRMRLIRAHFEKYVKSYGNQLNVDDYEDNTFINDMIYGIGHAITKADERLDTPDREDYTFFEGWEKFKTRLISMFENVKLDRVHINFPNS